MTARLGNNRPRILASEIQTAHAQAMAAARTSLQHAIAAGERLIEAKQLTGHGQWLAWLTANVSVSDRTAQAYMRLAKRRCDITVAESAAAADFTLRAALDAVAVHHEEHLPLSDIRLVPLYGHARVGITSGNSIWIVPSGRHPGFLFVTLITGMDGATEAIGGRRPVNISALDVMVDTVAPGQLFEWHDILAESWMTNSLLADPADAR